MNGFDFLNLVVGLIFVYLIYSIAVSTIWEIIISLSNMRARMLVKWMRDNFEKLKSDNGRSKIIDHPLAKGMLRKFDRKPSYIPSEVFAEIIMDLVVNEQSGETEPTGKETENPGNEKENSEEILGTVIDINTVKESLKKSNVLAPEIRRIFIQYVNEASGNLNKVKEKIGRWYDEAQERLIGSYKKSLQLWIVIISTILVGATNADTLELASYLYRNPQVSEAIAEKADLYIKDSAVIASISRIDTTLIDSIVVMDHKQVAARIENDLERLSSLNEELLEASIPIGWDQEDFSGWNWKDIIRKTGGLLLTILAVSLGAPFWFDVLSKLANLRTSGNKPKTYLEDRNSAKASK